MYKYRKNSWKSCIKSLCSRYVTYYGNDLNMFYVETKDALLLERKCQNHFKQHNITNELFELSHLPKYTEYLTLNAEKINAKTEPRQTNLCKNDTTDTYYVRNEEVPEKTMFDDLQIVSDGTYEKTYIKANDINNIFEIDMYGNIDQLTKNEYKYINEETFITYEGMLRVLFVSRSGKTKEFIKWATEKLFTIQMGTQEQKESLVSGILGIPAKSLRQVLSTSANNVPCIYRFALGKCSDLRKSMKISQNIPDDHIIIKYGFTDNLVRRTAEHMKTYNSIKKVNLELLNYAYVDPKYLSIAETDIKEFFVDIEKPIEYENFAELVAVDLKHEKQIMKQFKYITSQYSGCVKDLIDQIKSLKRDITNEKLKIENMEKLYIMEIEKKTMEIEKKNIEIENRDLKLQLMQLSAK